RRHTTCYRDWSSDVCSSDLLLGRNVEEAPWCGDPGRARAIAQRARSEGHVLGNHTYSHLRPDRWREFAADVRRGEAVLRLLRPEIGRASCREGGEVGAQGGG